MYDTYPSIESIAPSTSSSDTVPIILIAVFYGIMILLSITISLLVYIFRGIGLSKMLKALNLGGAWMPFLPIFDIYVFGKVAEQYVKKNGKKSARFSKIFMLLYLGVFATFFLFCLVPLVLILLFGTTKMMDSEIAAIFTFIIAVCIWIIYVALLVTISVIHLVALWRIYAIFAKDSATPLFILTIFFSIAEPFIIFAIRNNEPTCIGESQSDVITEI